MKYHIVLNISDAGTHFCIAQTEYIPSLVPGISVKGTVNVSLVTLTGFYR